MSTTTDQEGRLIRQLPTELSNKIAAGEVVQRPSSVVKELLDNAVDSGASKIELVIVNAGKTLIQVTDNGSGIYKEDLPFCFKRHATSKIQSVDDLFNIHSLGFRGEAMASIGSVAQVSVKSRTHEQEHGYELEIWGGEEKKIKPAPMEPGTTVRVQNLFFNVPARRAFLKTDSTEFRHILTAFQQIALANPDIGFTLITDTNEMYKMPPQDLKARIAAMFGKNYKASLIPVQEETTYVGISGFLIDPKLSKKTRGEQFLFVNGRPFMSRYLAYIIHSCYRDWIQQNEYPFYAINFTVDPKDVDVNVHPTKLEVKFEDERGIASITRTVVKKALHDFLSVPMQHRDRSQREQSDRYDLSFLNPSQGGSTEGDFQKDEGGDTRQRFESRINRQVRPPMGGMEAGKTLYDQNVEGRQDFSSQNLTNPGKQAENKPSYNRERGFWQLHDRYILSQTRSGLCVVDQHYAHKRILYEKALNSAESGLPSTQQLLFAQTIDFAATDFQMLKELIDDIQKMGFNIQLLSGNSAVVSGVPADLRLGDEKNVIESILSEYQQLKNINRFGQREKLAVAMASKAAIPRGRKLSLPEMEHLIDELFACDDPFKEPLGKPTLQYIPLEEFLAKFR